MVGLLILWLLCGVVCAGIASSKGKSVIGWLFLGCFLGVFGVILVAVLPSEGMGVNGVSGPSSGQMVHPSSFLQSSTNGYAKNSGLARDYDIMKWQALKEIDPEIRAAASRMELLGRRYEEALARKYLAIGEKSYLPAIESSISEASARERAISNSRLELMPDALRRASEQEMESYRAMIAPKAGRDPLLDLKVMEIEPYYGERQNYQGGIKISFEDGSTVLQKGRGFKHFPPDTIVN